MWSRLSTLSGRPVSGTGTAPALALTFAVVLLTAAVLPAGAATTLHVANCDAYGAGSLLETVAGASDGDTIVFDLDCTVMLEDPVSISGKSVTVSSNGHTVTLDASLSWSSHFYVDGTGGLTLSGLTLTKGAGWFGGAIDIGSGTVIVQNSTISGNSAPYGGAISNRGGVLTLQNSRLTSNDGSQLAGAIYNTGNLTILNSTLSGNSSGGFYGGAILNENGTLTVRGSTMSGNSVAWWGGAIYNLNGTVLLQNSTLTGNNAGNGGGATVNAGTFTIQNSTVTGNTAPSNGGIGGGGTSVANSIISGNANGNCDSAVTTDGGHNLEFGTTTCGFFNNAVTNDPLLGSLADNGGPTQTMALGSGSGAIGTGDATVCQTIGIGDLDQRGSARNAAARGTCDLGAYDTGGGSGPTEDTSLIRRSPSAIPADGVSTSTITVALKDASGNRVKKGGATVVVNTTLGSLSAVKDNGDGTYSATLRSATTPGQATISATVNGTPLPATTWVKFQPRRR